MLIYNVFAINKENKTCFYGAFDNRESAQSVIDELPTDLNAFIWPVMLNEVIFEDNNIF